MQLDKKKPTLARGRRRTTDISIGGYMKSIAKSSQEVKQISDDFARCPGCYNWHQRTSLVKYPSGTIADWRDYYLCQRCDYTLEYSAYDAAYNHILTNISVYDGGAE